MALTPGVLTLVAATSVGGTLNATKPGTGTAPFSYQFYRSTTPSFSPGPSNAVGSPISSSAASVQFTDTTAIPGTNYYYGLIATEAGVSPDTATYTQLAVTTLAPVQNPNQFAQAPYLGMLDLKQNPDTVSMMVDVTQATPMTAGQAVKVVNSAGGVPKVVACSADSDECAGFIVFDIKTVQYTAGMPCEVAMDQNVIYVYATGAVDRFAQVTLDVTTVGGVAEATGSSGGAIVGFAYDQAPTPGTLFRVKLKTPSFQLDS